VSPQKRRDDDRTEIIHDLDHPLDVPSASRDGSPARDTTRAGDTARADDTATAAFPLPVRGPGSAHASGSTADDGAPSPGAGPAADADTATGSGTGRARRFLPGRSRRRGSGSVAGAGAAAGKGAAAGVAAGSTGVGPDHDTVAEASSTDGASTSSSSADNASAPTAPAPAVDTGRGSAATERYSARPVAEHGSDTATTAFPAAYSDADPVGRDLRDEGPLPFGTEPARVEPATHDEVPRRGTADLGLFLLRLVVGGLLAARGVQKLFGLMGGPGVDGFADTLTSAGFQHGTVLSVAGGAVELVAGVMLVVGLATPVAVAGALALGGLGLAVALRAPEGLPLFSETARGLETPALYAGALLALLFCGPGRWSADRRWRWSHRPRFAGFVWLLVAVGAGVLVWYLLNGSNPLSGSVDSQPTTTG